MLNISPATTTRALPPVYEVLDYDFDADDEDAILEAVPQQARNQHFNPAEDGSDFDETGVPDAAFLNAANYYRGAFVDIRA